MKTLEYINGTAQVGDKVKVDTNIIGVNPRISNVTILQYVGSFSTSGYRGNRQFRVRNEKNVTFIIDEGMILEIL